MALAAAAPCGGRRRRVVALGCAVGGDRSHVTTKAFLNMNSAGCYISYQDVDAFVHVFDEVRRDLGMASA